MGTTNSRDFQSSIVLLSSLCRFRLLGFITFAAVWVNVVSRTCKILPTDHLWPSIHVWEAFNNSVGGNLIKAFPISLPCFESHFNANECQQVKDNWNKPNFYLPNPGVIMDSVFLNKSCDPFAGPNGPCTLGEYPEYVVNVSSPGDIINTVDFVKRHNVRLIVKNTGHDYMGRSIGHGSVSIWMHHQQSQEWFDAYDDPWSEYKGPAVKAHAGVLGEQLYTEADSRGYHVVVGECPTVGFTGGYIQGGGHSILSSYRGLAADHVLSFEAITTTGNFINASSTEHPDLFWALRGGGGGTYGIVWSVTLKVYRDIHISLATIMFETAYNSLDNFWASQEIYHRHSPTFTDAGAWVLASHTANTFIIPAFILPNRTLTQMDDLIKPMLNSFDNLGLNYTFTANEYPSYLSTIRVLSVFQNLPVNDAQFGGRLLPRSIWNSEESLQKMFSALRSIAERGVLVGDVSLSPSLEVAGNPDNAVFPQWRTAQRLIYTQIPFAPTTTIEQLIQDQRTLTSVDSMLKGLFPGIGAYHNEADPNTPDWKEDFWGENYERLLRIKDRYDPDQLLYGKIAVGGDRWAVNSDGRLCPVQGGIPKAQDEL